MRNGESVEQWEARVALEKSNAQRLAALVPRLARLNEVVRRITARVAAKNNHQNEGGERSGTLEGLQ